MTILEYTNIDTIILNCCGGKKAEKKKSQEA